MRSRPLLCLSMCKPLRIGWVQCARTWGHVLMGSFRGAIGSKMRRGIFGLDEMFATVAHVLSIAGFERLANVRVKNRRVVS